MNPPSTPPPNGGSEDPKRPNGPSANESARIIAHLEAHTNAVMINNEKLAAAEKAHATLAAIEKGHETLGKSIRQVEMLNLGPRVTTLERAEVPKQNVSGLGHIASRRNLIVWVCVVIGAAAIAFVIGRGSAAHDRDNARIAALELRLQALAQRQDIVVRDFHRLLDAFVDQRRQP